MKTALILYPHQLYSFDQLPSVDTVLVVEEPLYFGVDQEFPKRLHKQKLILYRAAMRRYVEEVLWPNGINVDYVELDVFMRSGDVFGKLKKFDELYMFDPVHEVLTQRLLMARREQSDMPAVNFLPSPNFYLQDQEVRAFVTQSHKDLFTEFYQWQRERFNVLIGDDYKPLGGSWMLQSEHADKKLPDDITPPGLTVFGDNQWVAEATAYVNEHFPDNPGSDAFAWPTSHAEAQKWLDDFIEHRLDNYGLYPDAFDGDKAWMFHSGLSVSLNVGLLSPRQAVDAALQRHARKPVPLESLELFVRDILGKRELTRGMYLIRHKESLGGSMPHKRRLTDAWYKGELGIPPFDDMVAKIRRHGYAQPNERIVLAANLMLLCEIDAQEVARWFSELCIDSDDWNVAPNIYDLFHFGTANTIEKRLPIVSSSYILQVSHYEKGVWCDVWDGLFWRFVEKYKTQFAGDAAFHALAQRLGRLDADRKRIIHYRAEDFLAAATRV